MYMSDDKLFALLEKQKTKKLASIAKHFKILAVPAKPIGYRQNLLDAIWFEIGSNIDRDKLIEMLVKRRKVIKKKRKTKHAKKHKKTRARHKTKKIKKRKKHKPIKRKKSSRK